MNLNEHKDLWNKIANFPLDEPGVVITFSKKLSAVQKWSAHFTERVIEEYRRFIFLCCISTNGASPSKAVDEAWHLHLTYTQSYWIDFCRNTLGKDIHHHPSRGGTQENHKHVEWYKETLSLYESAFGTEAPADIWPRPVNEQGEIPEPVVQIRTEIKILVIAILLLPFLFSLITFGKVFPYWLKGVEFLWFFPVLAIAGTASFFLIQLEKGRFYEQATDTYFPTGVPVFQAAKFLYGKHRAIQTGIVDLIRRNLLEVTPEKRFIIHNSRYFEPAKELNPLIPYFLNEDNNSTVNYEIISVNWYDEQKFTNPRLSKLFVFANKEETFLQKYWILTLVSLIGIIRFFQGMLSDHPVMLLGVQLITFLIIMIFVRRIFSRKALILKRAEKIYQQQYDSQKLYSDQMVSDFSIRGSDAILLFSDGIILSSLFAMYQPARWKSYDESYSSSCSSCGGGGGGCSGGGCGGGCGGCGGD